MVSFYAATCVFTPDLSRVTSLNQMNMKARNQLLVRFRQIQFGRQNGDKILAFLYGVRRPLLLPRPGRAFELCPLAEPMGNI